MDAKNYIRALSYLGSMINIDPMWKILKNLEKDYKFKEDGYEVRIGWDLINQEFFGVLDFSNDERRISVTGFSVYDVCEKMLADAKRQGFPQQVRQRLFEIYCKSSEMDDFYETEELDGDA